MQTESSNKPPGPVLARFFSSGVLKEFARTGKSPIASRLSHQYHLLDYYDPKMSLGEFYDKIFNQLNREYRHEYIYKNAIAEKILLGRHNLNTAFMLTEFRADECKADAVVLNGTSHVYEIKSEMDSFERIDRQLSAYKKLFDFITVITTERLFDSVAERVPDEVGIMVLAEKKYQFKKNECRREPESNKKNVDPEVIFNSLHRKEYLKIIKEVFSTSLEHLPNTQVYSEAKELFVQLSPEKAHEFMVIALKNRNQTLRMVDFIMDVPHSLKAASLALRLTNNERDRFTELLHKNIATTFI